MLGKRSSLFLNIDIRLYYSLIWTKIQWGSDVCVPNRPPSSLAWLKHLQSQGHPANVSFLCTCSWYSTHSWTRGLTFCWPSLLEHELADAGAMHLWSGSSLVPRCCPQGCNLVLVHRFLWWVSDQSNIKTQEIKKLYVKVPQHSFGNGTGTPKGHI